MKGTGVDRRETFLCWVWVCLLGCVVFGSPLRADDEELGPYSRRVLPAVRLSSPPVVDGDLSDAVWSEAAVGESFTHQKDGQLVPNQTRFWLGYDSENIYFAAHCFDAQPDRLLMLETKRDGHLWSDDNITFEIDPYHTHNWEDFSEFTVTPRGTQGSRIGGGRSGKAEWKGDWKAAARVVSDGWTAEMAIPWAILNYPNSDKPVTVGFNVRRNHARYRYESWFSNIGSSWRNEYAANWEGVLLPASAFHPEVLLLPFLAAGAREESNLWKRTARGGLDLRYRPTPSVTAVVTVNPDFRNVQGEVEGIDFSRGERWVRESRPFFQEGDDMFWEGASFGRLFYSRRIEKIDAGAKVYGKLTKRTNLGLLSALDFDDQHNDIRRIRRQDTVVSLEQGIGERRSAAALGSFRSGRGESNSVVAVRFGGRLTDRIGGGVQYGSSAFRGVNETQTAPIAKASPTLRGDFGSVGLDYWNGIVGMGGSVLFVSPGFRNANGLVDFPGRRGIRLFAGFENNWRNRFISEASGNIRAHYEERYENEGNGLDHFDKVVSRALSTLGDRDSTNLFFRDSIGYFQWTRFRNNIWFSHDGDIGHFREEGAPTSDLDWSWGFGLGGSNATRTLNLEVRYHFGRADGTFRHFIAPNVFYKRGNLSTGVNLSLLRHVERLHQHVWSVNYDLSKAMTVGGRLVFRRDERRNDNTWNAYFSFRRSGEAGYETFLIFGDPSADRFIPRVEGKLLFPL